MYGHEILPNLNDVMILCTQAYSMSEVCKAEQSTINMALDSLAQPTGVLQEADEDQNQIVPYEPAPPRIYRDLIPYTSVARSAYVGHQYVEVYGG